MQKIILTLKTQKIFRESDVPKLRGYIGNLFINECLFHNHLDEYNFLYQSSRIQYKLINNSFSIVGIGEEAIKLIKEKVLLIDMLNIGGDFEKIIEKNISQEEFKLEIEEDLYKYTFLTPWIALNQINYKRYKEGELKLDKALQNNLIEFFKMCDTWADKEIKVKGDFKETLINKKDVKMLGFKGWFVTNVKLPNYIGLGKSKSLGFGTILKEE